jgi:hypothetical protein
MKTIEVSILNQNLELLEPNNSIIYQVSTSKYGPGELKNSHCTPIGKHIIRAKIGEGQPIGMIFKGRRPTGKIFNKKDNNQSGDWILTRILWLSGLEIEKNRLGDVDTMQRYIYIHGVPDHYKLGIPRSIGCVNMYNEDIIDLFNRVEVGTEVNIR